MAMVPFDTLRLSRMLRDKAHFTQDQSDGFAEALAEAFQDDLVTKQDLREEISGLRSDLRAEIAMRVELYKALSSTQPAVIM